MQGFRRFATVCDCHDCGVFERLEDGDLGFEPLAAFFRSLVVPWPRGFW
jgi:hypothetical protein